MREGAFGSVFDCSLMWHSANAFCFSAVASFTKKTVREILVGQQVHGVPRGPPPEEVLSNARARVTKLEAALAAVRESNPTYARLQDALKKAKAQAQVRPVADRIASTGEEENHHWSRRSFHGLRRF